MFSGRTVGYLEGLCHASDATYPEGGAVFSLKQSHNSANAELPSELQEAFRLLAPQPHLVPSPQQIADLARFIQGMLGRYTPDSPSGYAVAAAHHLERLLYADLGYDLIHVHTEDWNHGMGMELQVVMARKRDNNLFSLESSWQVD
ncbi:hypothetical protein OPU71_20520 [Niveibacterium sp. 24ML]|uniref:hypothetical protein n=1 Tax=Niveibacterium sp. 24ML TaxID=2985512 RepID=UPI00226E967F|nr:hypothetical protein [Niveibacterium sp. 24ML]MCX9158514.1 hypothetical protein [Niveibacterium sp. 24ML]